MGILNKAKLNGIGTSLSALFHNALGAAKPMYTEIATVVTSTGESQSYPFSNLIKGIREWIGERVINPIKDYEYLIKNKKWEDTISVPREAIEDDNLGIYNSQATSLGNQAARFPDKLVAQALLAGISELCYDGQNFFDTDHPFGEGADAGVFSNSFSHALTATNFAIVRAAMRVIPDDTGEVGALDINPVQLIVPPELESAALEIVNAERNAAGATNVLKDSAKVVVMSRLSADPTRWYLADPNQAVRGIIFQERTQPELESLTDPGSSDIVFLKDIYVWGTRQRNNVGFGLPQVMATSKP